MDAAKSQSVDERETGVCTVFSRPLRMQRC